MSLSHYLLGPLEAEINAQRESYLEQFSQRAVDGTLTKERKLNRNTRRALGPWEGGESDRWGCSKRKWYRCS